MMTSPFAAAIAAAAAGSPMSNGDTAQVEGRLLLADGDGLCYYCAGDDETSPGEARKRLLDKLAAARRASGATEVKIVTTARESHKGYRYAVARVKPYQGQRTTSRRPKNWIVLREFLEAQDMPPGITVEFTAIAEADDLFSRYAMNHPNCVIYTQDKDMRMVPGWHLDWLTHLMFKLGDEWSATHNEKLWGRHWFWTQMLMGDATDNIPGLPKFREDEKSAFKQCGEVTAGKLLAKASSDLCASLTLQRVYRSFYGDRWLVEMLEQAILLWMRNDAASSPFNVCAPGNPFATLAQHADYPAAKAEILDRINKAQFHEEAQGERDTGGEGDFTPEEQHAMRALYASVQSGPSGAGPLSLDGDGAGHAAPLVQCPAGEGGEQLPQVRREQPVGVPSWVRLVLAKA